MATIGICYYIEIFVLPQSEGIDVRAELAYGNPGEEIVKWVEKKGCDLVTMNTHGHRIIADIFLGATASRVQHRINGPSPC